MTQTTGGLYWPPLFFALLIAALAVSALILWRRYQSRHQLISRVAELEALSQAGRSIVEAEMDVEALAGLIAENARAAVETGNFQIGLFEGDFYQIMYWTRGGTLQEVPHSFDLSQKPGLVGFVRDTRQPLLIKDFEVELATLEAAPRYVSDNPPRSALFVPLISGSEVIGLIAAQDEKPNCYDRHDLDRLTILANQASAAIANARMFEEERTRAAQLELVVQIAQQVNAINDLDELFAQVVVLTKETFGFSSVNIFGIDPESGYAVVEASSVQEYNLEELKLAPGEGLIGTAVQTRETTLSNNTVDDRRFLGGSISAQTKSEICVPLIVDDELLGVLDVQSASLGAFTPRVKLVVEALAAQVAIAVHKARQFELQRRQAWITTAQLQVADAVAEDPDLQTMAGTIVRLFPLLLGVEHSAILQWNEDLNIYEPLAVYGISDETEATFLDSMLRIGQWSALDAVHVGRESLWTSQMPPWLPISQVGSLKTRLLPMVSHGSTFGIIVNCMREEVNTNADFSREELEAAVVKQVTQSMDNLRTRTAQQEEAWVNTALLQVSEAVNRLTNLDEILYTIVRMVPLLVGIKSCFILIWEEENESFRAGPSHGLSELGEGVLSSFEVQWSEFPQMQRQDIDRLGPDAAYYTTKVPRWLETILGAANAIIFPLYARARMVGAMVVGPAQDDRALSGRRLNIVTGIAQQAAIAVVNDRLYKESAERSRIEQELNVARAIQASLIPVEDPPLVGAEVASYWSAAREVSGDFFDYYDLEDGRWGIAVADVADKGVPAALFMAVCRTILRTVAFNRKNPADVLMRANNIIFGDTTSDLFVTVFYAVYDSKKRSLTYASGGHNPALLVRSDGSVRLLQTRGIALGVLEDVEIEEKTIRLNNDDVLVMYTDGITEAMNEDYDEFGLDRLSNQVRKMRTESVEEIKRAITESVSEHTGSAPQFDDVTLVVIKA